MRKSLLFIYNPFSGTQTIAKKLSDVVNVFTKAGYDVTCHPTQSKGDCIETIAQYKEKYDLAVVSGGDGTLNEAVNGIMKNGIDKPLGYIPTGSTNDFSHSVGISSKIAEAAETAVSGREFLCDLGKHNDRFFTYVAGFGAFTEVSYSTPQDYKNALGFLAYVIEAITALPNIKAYKLKYIADERTGEGEYLLGLITNTNRVAGMKNLIMKDITLDDGLFEVVLLKKPKNLKDLHTLNQEILAWNFENSVIECFKTSKLVIECDEPLAWTLDGENGGEHKVSTVENHKQSLKIIVK